MSCKAREVWLLRAHPRVHLNLPMMMAGILGVMPAVVLRWHAA